MELTKQEIEAIIIMLKTVQIKAEGAKQMAQIFDKLEEMKTRFSEEDKQDG